MHELDIRFGAMSTLIIDSMLVRCANVASGLWGRSLIAVLTVVTFVVPVDPAAAQPSFVDAGSAASRHYVQKAYVSYYGRPADPEGRGYWASRVDAEGGSLDPVIGEFGRSDEFNRRYGGLNPEELVTKIYQQALNRNPDPAGLAFYVAELQAGHRTLQTITLNVVDGATTAPDSTTVYNKLTVADYFTASVAAGCAYGGEQLGVDTLASVTSDAATVAAAKAAIDLRCTGGHTVNPAVYSVPTDLAKVTYPDSYTTPLPERLNVSVDICELSLPAVTYPQSWIGQHPLPKVTGAPLKSSYTRGMAIKDILLPGNPAFVLPGAPGAPQGCEGDLQAELAKTIARLKILGVDYIAFPQWHWLSKRPDGTWYVVRAEDSFGPLGDADLTFLVKTAHAAGMKVHVRNQIQGMVDSYTSGGYSPAPTYENLQKFFSAYQPYMIERAGFFQTIGVDTWDLDCGACWIAGLELMGQQYVDFIVGQYVQTAANIKPLFAGRLAFNYAPWLESAHGVLDQVDILQFGLSGLHNAFTADQVSQLSVEKIKALIGWSGPYFERVLDKLGKTFLFAIAMQSRANAFTVPGYVEETACVASMGDLAPSSSGCIQRETQPDFSLQANFYEAVLELIGQLNLHSPVIVLPGDYWVTEQLAPATTFPNLAASMRNKPAEGILKAWYARP